MSPEAVIVRQASRVPGSLIKPGQQPSPHDKGHGAEASPEGRCGVGVDGESRRSPYVKEGRWSVSTLPSWHLSMSWSHDMSGCFRDCCPVVPPDLNHENPSKRFDRIALGSRSDGVSGVVVPASFLLSRVPELDSLRGGCHVDRGTLGRQENRHRSAPSLRSPWLSRDLGRFEEGRP